MPFTSVVLTYTTDRRQLEKADRLIDRAETLYPEYRRTPLLRAAWHRASGNVKAALSSLDTVIQLDPTYSTAHSNPRYR